MLESKTKHQLGIWMDHARAHLIENKENASIITIESGYDHITHVNSYHKSEFQLEEKKRKILLDYYDKLGEFIINYSEVVLFGPTDAKLELSNMLKKDNDFDHIHISTQSSDKKTENQQIAFVKNFFQHNIFRNFESISPKQ
jgi:hypothetical protein